MQISTNWSVSHLRHWRPPVASSGYYLYRYTGRSWFKSKQSALRSILADANIHLNEKRPGSGRGQTPDVHFGVCVSPRGKGWKGRSKPGLKQHTPNRTEKTSHDVREWMRASVWRRKKVGGTVWRWRTDKVGVPVKGREFMMGGSGMGWVVGVTMSKATTER